MNILENNGIKTLNGNFLKTDIDTICEHGDGKNAAVIAQMIKNGLTALDNGENAVQIKRDIDNDYSVRLLKPEKIMKKNYILLNYWDGK